MPPLPPFKERFHRGSFLTAGWDLRVTFRCVEDDLDRDAADALDLARLHRAVDIIRSFVNKRRQKTDDTSPIEPLTSGRTVYALRHTHDHRGATWYDDRPSLRTVWLCAYRLHRSGEPDDAYPYFKELEAEGRFFPTADDYDAFIEEKDERFAELAVVDAGELVEQARANPGVEIPGRVGGEHGVYVTVEAADDLEALYLVVDLNTLQTDWLETLLVAFDPNAEFAEWEQGKETPTRTVEDDEYVFSLHRWVSTESSGGYW
ncbi:MAG TPA: hypothetical protein VLC07_09295 [Solirubrobacterales bacterium]|jgi:hypothetical protein|nr:hypothetical protein [Solirubrobacterales bacterium]